MEYEQLENGGRVIRQSVLSQDVGSYYELLHPNVILVTHFPYPELETEGTAATARISPALAIARSDALHGRTAAQRRAELLREQKAVRAAQDQRYQQHLRARAAASQGGGKSGAKSAAGDGAEGEEEEDGGDAAPTAAAVPAPAVGGDAAAAGGGKPHGAGGAPRRKKPTAASAAGGGGGGSSLVTAALQGKREHRGITFYFAQPPPLVNDAEGEDGSPGDASAAQQRRSVAPAAAGRGGKGAAAAAAAEASTSALQAAVAAEYGDFVDVAEGRQAACARFGLLLSWLNEDAYVADMELQLDPRKSILQDAEVLPAPPVPKTPQEAFAQLGRQHTDRNQQLSRLVVTWGREFLAFRDQMHLDDGHVVCIHRRMLTLKEMLAWLPAGTQGWSLAEKTDRIRQELRDFYGVTRSRVAAKSHALPLLDFSFCPIGDDINRLLAADVTPASGCIHTCRPERPEEDPRLVQGVFLNAENDPTRKTTTTRTLIKAKNKLGDEGAYEFTVNGKQRYEVFGGPGDGGEASGAAGGTIGPEGWVAGGEGERRPYKFAATTLRITGCGMVIPDPHAPAANAQGSGAARRGGDAAATDRKPPRFINVVRGLVANAAIALSVLDLSDNRLSLLPDLSLLPLQKLLLHGNSISDWAQVDEHVCPLPYLSSVSLHGNPIADTDPDYRVKALGRLVNSPERKVPLRQFDLVTLTAQDFNQMGVRREKR